MTLNEITSLIAEPLDRQNDLAFRLTVAERVKMKRSRLIANSVQKVGQQRKFFRQSLIMKMEEAPDTCLNLNNCKKEYRTVDDIPLPVRINNTLFDYVGSLDGNVSMREADPGTAPYLMATSWYKPKLFRYINNRIYTSYPVDYLMVDGIYDDPAAVYKFNCSAQNKTCDVWDAPFPVSGDLLDIIVNSVVTEFRPNASTEEIKK